MSFNAVGAAVDLPAHARELVRTRSAVFSGGRPADGPRVFVARSWSRALTSGLDPQGTNPRITVPAGEYERRQHLSPLGPVIHELRQVVSGYADAASCLLVVTDADGVILWREGTGRVRLRADTLGFVEGAEWTEQHVGTNAIGTALAEAAPVQLFAAEHFEQQQTAWYCTAAPIHDPRSGELLGILDLSGPALSLHPMVAPLVASMVRLGEHALWRHHGDALERLRASSAAKLSTVGSPAVLVDEQGWVASSIGVPPRDRVAVPQEGVTMIVPGIGVCLPERLNGGWLLRPSGPDVRVRLQLRLSQPPVLRTVTGDSPWRVALTRKHAEILLLLLAAGRDGLSNAALSRALYGDTDHITTVRAEVSRLRRVVGSIVATRPYRLADDTELQLDLDGPDDITECDLIRSSTAPLLRDMLVRYRAGS